MATGAQAQASGQYCCAAARLLAAETANVKNIDIQHYSGNCNKCVTGLTLVNLKILATVVFGVIL